MSWGYGRSEARAAEVVQRGHELESVRVRGVLWCVAGLIMAAVVIHFALGGLYAWFAAMHPGQTWGAAAEGLKAPPGPVLQVSPAVEMQQLREEQERRLGSYGWVDREKGVARIPIEEAMRIVVERERARKQGGER